MKYVLFALSILLLLTGGYSVFTGLPIIEVERGWASVIAGTTALVGGALLFGIGWVVRALEQLRAAVLAAEKSGLSAPLAAAARDFRPDEMLNEDRRPLRPETAAPAWPPHTSPAGPSANEQKEALLAAYAARGERRPEVRQEVRQDAHQDLHDEVRDEIFEEDEDFAAEAESILRTPLTEGDRPVREKPAANIRDFWRRNAKAGDKKNPPSRPFQKRPLGAVASVFEPHPKPMAAANAPLPEPQDDDFATTDGSEPADWLQSNFSQAGTASEPHPVLDEMPADFESYEAMGEKDIAPPMAADATGAENEGEVEEPAVIGHYEAEGTSYTMFSDGSIEAQSERGVARFNSMAELKAFFETQETPQ
ncbi:MAG: hypothetical protein ABSC72_05865 [Methylovirgula sp.]|jgi:hypothetical protein